MMSQASIDSILKILSILIWPASIGVILLIASRFQKQIAQDEVNQVKLKENEIEKTVDKLSLEQLVDLNNKDGKG